MELKKAIKILKELLNSKISFTFCPEDEGYKAIKTVLKELDRLQRLNFAEIQNMFNEASVNLYKYYIHKDKIKAKIEEYKDLLSSCNRLSDIDRIKAINERILAYEELLESEE